MPSILALHPQAALREELAALGRRVIEVQKAAAAANKVRVYNTRVCVCMTRVRV